MRNARRHKSLLTATARLADEPSLDTISDSERQEEDEEDNRKGENRRRARRRSRRGCQSDPGVHRARSAPAHLVLFGPKAEEEADIDRAGAAVAPGPVEERERKSALFCSQQEQYCLRMARRSTLGKLRSAQR